MVMINYFFSRGYGAAPSLRSGRFSEPRNASPRYNGVNS
nr:MAG TPA: hypothetical protein [Microviridae sp.]